MTTLTTRTTTEDVLTLFMAAPSAEAEYRSWIADARYRETVVPRVQAHHTEVIYSLTTHDVAKVCEATQRMGGHALGNVRQDEGIHIPEVNNWNPPFAFSHVFHRAVESLGIIPTWPGFVRYINKTPEGWELLGNEQERLTQHLAPRWGVVQTMNAMQWRLGNAYYSFLRELHVLTHLRAAGVDAQVHPLADALFRVDAWFRTTALVLYIGNDAYRNGPTGRKKEAERILAGAASPFSVVQVNLPRQHHFGEVHLPPATAIENVAQEMLDRNSGTSRMFS